MRNFKQLLTQTGFHQGKDGFASSGLRRLILKAVVLVPATVPAANRRSRLTPEERRKLDYLSRSSLAGRDAAFEMVARTNIRDPFLQSVVLAGAGSIGAEIGVEYGSQLYPAACRRPDKGGVIPTTKTCFGFEITTQGSDQQITAVIPMAGPPGSGIYDEEAEGVKETFIFATIDEAVAARQCWQECFENNAAPPVAYQINLFLPDPEIGLDNEISWPVHVPADTGSMKDEDFRETQVFPTIRETMRRRAELIERYYLNEESHRPVMTPEALDRPIKVIPPVRSPVRRRDSTPESLTRP